MLRQALSGISHFILKAALRDKYQHSQFTDEETEIQRGTVSVSGHTASGKVKAEYKLKPAWLKEPELQITSQHALLGKCPVFPAPSPFAKANSNLSASERLAAAED